MENNWCIKLTEENKESVISYLNEKYNKLYEGDYDNYYGVYELSARVSGMESWENLITFDEFKQMVAKELKSQIVETTVSDSKFLQGLENDTKEVSGTPSYYDNSKGSLYQFAEHHKLNAWEFDIVKRIVRCREKGNFIKDLEKTKKVIDLYLLEYGK